MTFSTALDRLSGAFARPLPGAAAQHLMAPHPRRGLPEGFNPARLRLAAGLLLLVRDDDAAHVVLTVRGDALGRHSGQVSLPGGALEPGETFEQAALRETHEEIGLDTGDVTLLGALTPLEIPVSRFRFHPLVGAIARRPALHPADGEVASILEVPLAQLLAPATCVRNTREHDGERVVVPAFRLGRHELWGATAMVMAEFLSLLGWTGPDVTWSQV